MEPFNPYYAWLGLDEDLAQPNYYQLLRLRPEETDYQKIMAAADKALQRVQSHTAGEHIQAWNELLETVRQAKQTLLDSASRAAYDQKIFPKPVSSDPQVMSAPATGYGYGAYPAPGMTAYPGYAAPTNNAPNYGGVPGAWAYPQYPAPPQQPNASMAMGQNPMAPAPMTPSPMSPMGFNNSLPAWRTPPAGPAMPPPVATPGTAPFNPMAPVAFAAPVGFAEKTSVGTSPQAPWSPTSEVGTAFKPPGNDNLPVPPPFPVGTPGTHAALPTGMPVGSPELNSGGYADALAVKSMHLNKQRSSSQLVSLIAIAVSTAVILIVVLAVAFSGKPEVQEKQITHNPAIPEHAGEAKQPETPKTPDVTEPVKKPPVKEEKPKAPAVTTPETKNETKTTPPEMKPEEKPTTVEVMKPETMPTPTTPTPTTPPPTATNPPPTTPTPTPTPETEPSPVELAQLTKLMNEAKAALGDFTFDEALAKIEQAEKMAKTPEIKAKVERLKNVTDLAKQFFDAIQRTVEKLEATEVVTIGSTKVAVVETGPNKLVLRVAGMNRTYSLNDLPQGLAISLGERSLAEGSPATAMVKGAYLYVDKRTTPETMQKARGFFEEAQLRGLDIADLMKIFDDKYEPITTADLN